MELLPQTDPILGKIAALHDKQRALILELNKSLYIRSLWPDAFLHGSRCTVRIGTHTCHEWDQFLLGKYEIKDAALIRLDDGAAHMISAEEFRTLHFMPGGKS